MKITTHIGCLVGLAVIFTWRLAGGCYECEFLKSVRWLSAIFFVFNCWIKVPPALVLTSQKLTLPFKF